jgi:hypothetical protein
MTSGTAKEDTAMRWLAITLMLAAWVGCSKDDGGLAGPVLDDSTDAGWNPGTDGGSGSHDGGGGAPCGGDGGVFPDGGDCPGCSPADGGPCPWCADGGPDGADAGVFPDGGCSWCGESDASVLDWR